MPNPTVKTQKAFFFFFGFWTVRLQRENQPATPSGITCSKRQTSKFTNYILREGNRARRRS